MAATYTLSGNPKTLLGGEDFTLIRAYVTCDQDTLVALDTKEERVFGEADVILKDAASTEFSIELPGNDWLPSPHFYTLHIEGRSRTSTTKNRVVTSRPFQMTADITLADLPQAAPKAITVQDYENLYAAAEEAVAAATSAQEAAEQANAPTDGQVGTSLANRGLPTTGTELSASIGGQANTVLEQFGGSPDATEAENTEALASFASSPFGRLKIGSNAYDLGEDIETVDLPYWKSVEGDSRESRINLTDATGLTGAVQYRLNSDESAPGYQEFPGLPGSVIRGLDLHNVSGTATVTAFEFNGKPRFEDLTFVGYDQVIRQATEYCDVTSIDRLDVIYKPDSSVYAVQLTGTGGDGSLVSRVATFIEPVDDYRPKAVWVRFKNGAKIELSINGDHLIQDSTGVEFAGAHLENGQVVFDNSSGTIHDNVFYKRNRLGQKCVPLVLRQPNGQAGFAGMVLDLSTNVFACITGLGGSYPTDVHDFEISTPSSVPRMLIHSRGMVRLVGSNNGYTGTRVLVGTTCGDPDYDNYSHIGSQEFAFRNGRFDLSARRGALVASTGLQGSGGVVVNNDLVWAGSSGTYYYRVSALLDKQRLVGRVGSSEQSTALVAGQSGATLLLAPEFRDQGLMIRVYRGTSAGSYSHFADVPMISGGRLFDAGTDINTVVWQSRTPGPADALLEHLTDTYSLAPGEVTTTSDAYGHVEIAASASTRPDRGAWRRGDLIRLRNPFVNHEGGVLYGWLRLTDCLLSESSKHVEGTDWRPITAPKEFYYRAGTPEGNITAGYGAICMRTDGFSENSTLYVKTSSTGNTGWKSLKTTTPFTATTAELNSATNAINTTAKFIGKEVFNTTTGKPVFAVGTTATAVWNDATGTAAHTPA